MSNEAIEALITKIKEMGDFYDAEYTEYYNKIVIYRNSKQCIFDDWEQVKEYYKNKLSKKEIEALIKKIKAMGHYYSEYKSNIYGIVIYEGLFKCIYRDWEQVKESYAD